MSSRPCILLAVGGLALLTACGSPPRTVQILGPGWVPLEQQVRQLSPLPTFIIPISWL